MSLMSHPFSTLNQPLGGEFVDHPLYSQLSADQSSLPIFRRNPSILDLVKGVPTFSETFSLPLFFNQSKTPT